VIARNLNRRSFLLGSAGLAGSAALAPLRGLGRPGAPGRAVVRSDRDIRQLDPAHRTGSVEGNVLRSTHRRLIRFEPGSLEYELDAAASLRQVDERTLEFELRPEIRFPDPYGDLTSEDVKFSFERFRAGGPQASPYADDWAALEGVEVLGTHRGRIHLEHPAPALWRIGLADTSGCILPRRAVEALGGRLTELAHAGGPYRIARWTPNQELVLASNPDYAGAPPPLTEIVMRPVQDEKTTELALRAGELDFTALEPAVARTLEGRADVRLLWRDAIHYVWVGLNVEHPPLDDGRVRRAIRAAIDVEAALLAGWDGAVPRARTLLAPPLLGHWTEAPVHRRNVEGARRLLAEAGLPEGFATRLTLLNKPSHQAAALVIQANLAEIGVRVTLDVHDAGTFWSLGKGRSGEKLELVLQRFGGKLDPSFQTQWFVSAQVGLWNWQRWRSAEFDALHERAASILDAAERARLYMRMQTLMEESAAFVWLTHEANVFGSRTWLEPAVLPTGDDWQFWNFREAAS
jgi:peptide/nickel transport system substrate-binding protein